LLSTIFADSIVAGFAKNNKRRPARRTQNKLSESRRGSSKINLAKAVPTTCWSGNFLKCGEKAVIIDGNKKQAELSE